jgi:hypothetical protein
MQTAKEDRKFKIDIYDFRDEEVTINWAAYGSVSIQDAIAFRNALNAAIEEAAALGYQNFLEATKDGNV